MADGKTPMPIIKAYGTVQNPPHGWGTLTSPEAEAEGVVKNPEGRDGVPAPRPRQ